MIVQIILSLGLMSLALYTVSQRSRSRVIAWLMLLVCGSGEVLVLAPDLSTEIAHRVGVGRGADLILYCFIVATLGLIMNLHLRLRAMNDEMTEVARRVALLTALEPGPDNPNDAE